MWRTWLPSAQDHWFWNRLVHPNGHDECHQGAPGRHRQLHESRGAAGNQRQSKIYTLSRKGINFNFSRRSTWKVTSGLWVAFFTACCTAALRSSTSKTTIRRRPASQIPITGSASLRGAKFCLATDSSRKDCSTRCSPVYLTSRKIGRRQRTCLKLSTVAVSRRSNRLVRKLLTCLSTLNLIVLIF